MDNSIERVFWYVVSVAFFFFYFFLSWNKEMKVVGFEAKLPMLISTVLLQWCLARCAGCCPEVMISTWRGICGRIYVTEHSKSSAQFKVNTL